MGETNSCTSFPLSSSAKITDRGKSVLIVSTRPLFCIFSRKIFVPLPYDAVSKSKTPMIRPVLTLTSFPMCVNMSSFLSPLFFERPRFLP